MVKCSGVCGNLIWFCYARWTGLVAELKGQQGDYYSTRGIKKTNLRVGRKNIPEGRAKAW